MTSSVSMGLKGSQEIVVFPKELIFMTQLCVIRLRRWQHGQNMQTARGYAFHQRTVHTPQHPHPRVFAAKSCSSGRQQSCHHLPSPTPGYFPSFPGSLAPSVLSWVTSGCGLRGRLAKVRQIQRCLPCGSEAGFSSSYEEQGPREES